MAQPTPALTQRELVSQLDDGGLAGGTSGWRTQATTAIRSLVLTAAARNFFLARRLMVHNKCLIGAVLSRRNALVGLPINVKSAVRPRLFLNRKSLREVAPVTPNVPLFSRRGGFVRRINLRKKLVRMAALLLRQWTKSEKTFYNNVSSVRLGGMAARYDVWWSKYMSSKGLVSYADYKSPVAANTSIAVPLQVKLTRMAFSAYKRRRRALNIHRKLRTAYTPLHAKLSFSVIPKLPTFQWNRKHTFKFKVIRVRKKLTLGSTCAQRHIRERLYELLTTYQCVAVSRLSKFAAVRYLTIIINAGRHKARSR